MNAIVCRIDIELFIAGANSLKEKRAVVKRAVERIKARCNASAAEIGYQDVWQRAGLGVAIIGEPAVVRRQAEAVRRIIDGLDEAEIIRFDIMLL